MIKILFLFLLPFSAFCQLVDLQQSVLRLDGQSIPAIQIRLDIDPDDVKGYWDDFMDDEININIKGLGFLQNKDILYTESVTIPQIAEFPIVLSLKFEDWQDRTLLSLYAQKRDNTFLSQENELIAYNNMEAFAKRFLAYFLPQYYHNEMKKANENYQDGKDDLDKVKKKIERNTDRIARHEESIEDLKDENEELFEEKRDLQSLVAKRDRQLNRKRYTYQEIEELVRKLQ